MNKLIIKTKTKTKDYKFEKMIIQTNTYESKIKAHSVHVIPAAKIILTKDKVVTSLFVMQPIIISDANKNVTIWTKSTFEHATLAIPYLTLALEENNKIDNKIFNAKKILGLTSDEHWRFVSTEAVIEMKKLIKKTLPLDKGGGF